MKKLKEESEEYFPGLLETLTDKEWLENYEGQTPIDCLLENLRACL
ncbi:MAG: hypothetical protein ACTSQG_00215 [Promethearchaeota archaeon]